MNKIKEIISAWSSTKNPTDDQKELAEKRYEICKKCPKRETKLGYEICNACGCPLNTKVFSKRRENACPLDKWSELDKKFS